MRVFTGSPDSIRHQGTSGNSWPNVMLLELEADMSTIYGQVSGRGGRNLGEREANKKIGTLIACRKRQQYAKLCEADLDSGDCTGRGPGGRAERKLSRKISARAGRAANHP